MSLIHNPSRTGSALVISSIVVITIAGMAIALTDLTIGRYTEQKYRQAQVDLLAATESAANESINWMKNNPAVQNAMKNMAISSKPGFPEAPRSTSSVLVSTSLPSGLPPVFPALKTKTAYKPYYPPGTTQGPTYMIETDSVGANEANSRNTCTVETKVIKVASSASPSLWDGSERFIVYTTAEFGDRTRPESVRRQRVETVITAVSTTSTSTATTTTSTSVPTPAFPFTRGLFSLNGYDFGGAATTDSWRSDANMDGKADTPYTAATAADFAAGKRNKGDLGSNGSLGSGAYDTSRVHGKAEPFVNASLPTVTYNPPTTGVTSVGNITANRTLTGVGTGTTSFRATSVAHKNSNTLTIAGTGTVVLYVDGGFNVGNVVFAAGSTAKVIIQQNDAPGKGCSFNSQNNIGDPNDPKRLMLVTAYSGDTSLNGGAHFSAVVLSPNGTIKMNGGSHFYGAFVAKDFSGKINGNFSFHYDESLSGLSWGSIMTTVTTTTTTTTTVPVLSMLAPTAWNVRSVGYDAP